MRGKKSARRRWECEGWAMAIDLSAFERIVRAQSSTWEALGVAYVIHPVSPNHGKPVVWADFEGAGHLATVISWVSGETELESTRVADGRIVNRPTNSSRVLISKSFWTISLAFFETG